MIFVLIDFHRWTIGFPDLFLFLDPFRLSQIKLSGSIVKKTVGDPGRRGSVYVWSCEGATLLFGRGSQSCFGTGGVAGVVGPMDGWFWELSL